MLVQSQLLRPCFLSETNLLVKTVQKDEFKVIEWKWKCERQSLKLGSANFKETSIYKISHVRFRLSNREDLEQKRKLNLNIVVLLGLILNSMDPLKCYLVVLNERCQKVWLLTGVNLLPFLRNRKFNERQFTK